MARNSGSRRSAVRSATSRGWRHAMKRGFAFNDEPKFKRSRKQCDGTWRDMSDGRLLKDALKRAKLEAWRITYGQK